MAFQEQAKIVPGRIEHDVSEDATPCQMNADRKAVREVPSLPPLAVADRHVRQIFRLDAGERRQVIGFVLGGAKPDHLRVFDDGVEHHETLDRVVQGERSPQRTVGSTRWPRTARAG